MVNFEEFQISLDKFGQVWTSLDKFGQVWTSLDKFGQVWTSLDKFEIVTIHIILNLNVSRFYMIASFWSYEYSRIMIRHGLNFEHFMNLEDLENLKNVVSALNILRIDL